MNPSTITALIIGTLDVLDRALEIARMLKISVPPEVQEQVAKRVEAIRSGGLFDAPHWKP